MSKTFKKILFALFVIAAAILGVLAWKKYKAIKDETDDSSDIFEEDDFDLDEAI